MSERGEVRRLRIEYKDVLAPLHTHLATESIHSLVGVYPNDEIISLFLRRSDRFNVPDVEEIKRAGQEHNAICFRGDDAFTKLREPSCCCEKFSVQRRGTRSAFSDVVRLATDVQKTANDVGRRDALRALQREELACSLRGGICVLPELIQRDVIACARRRESKKEERSTESE